MKNNLLIESNEIIRLMGLPLIMEQEDNICASQQWYIEIERLGGTNKLFIDKICDEGVPPTINSEDEKRVFIRNVNDLPKEAKEWVIEQIEEVYPDNHQTTGLGDSLTLVSVGDEMIGGSFGDKVGTDDLNEYYEFDNDVTDTSIDDDDDAFRDADTHIKSHFNKPSFDEMKRKHSIDYDTDFDVDLTMLNEEYEVQRIRSLHNNTKNLNGILITEQSNKIYTTTGDKYQYKIVNGKWWAKGPKLPQWKDISGNVEAVKTLDKRHPAARTPSSPTTERTKISGTVPFTNSSEGNAFRAWVRSDRSRYGKVLKALINAGLKNKGNKSPTLGESGKYDNNFMKIAWKTVGNDYKNKNAGKSKASIDVSDYPQDRKEGDFFRKWMKGKYPEWKDGDEPLDFKGPNLHTYKNATIAAAWKEHGEEFRKSGVMEKYENINKLPLASGIINPGDFESVILSDTLKNDGVMFDPTKNQIVGVCTQKGCGQYVSDQFKEVVPEAHFVGNAWHAHKINQGQSAFRGMDSGTVNDIVTLFNKINKNPREGSEEVEAKKIVKNLIPSQNNFKNLKLNDLVGLYYDGSHNFTKAFYEGLTGYNKMGSGEKGGAGPFLLNKDTNKGWAPADIGTESKFTAQGTNNLGKGNGPGLNTHVGYVGAIVDGDPIIFHNVDKKVWTTPLSKMDGRTSILWSRPSGATAKGVDIKKDKGYWDKFVDYVWG